MKRFLKLSVIDLKNKDEIIQQIQQNHIEYYKSYLNYLSDKDFFSQQIKQIQYPNLSPSRLEFTLETRPKNHFGEASSMKIQSLLFMIREN